MPSKDSTRPCAACDRPRSGSGSMLGGGEACTSATAGWSSMAVTVLALVSLCGRGAEAVSNGGDHSCSVFTDKTIKCWGANGNGQLGLGDLSSRGAAAGEMGDALAEVDLGADFLAAGVSCGLDHSCAWSSEGKVKCWGGNLYGQLGLGDTQDRGGTALSMGDDLPYVNLGSGMIVQKVVAANHFTCALLGDLTVKCFGRNDFGQLGSGNGTNNLGDAAGEMGNYLPSVELVPVGANYSVSALDAHNGPCVVMQSDVSASVAVKCWGPNGYGSLGLGDAYNRGDDLNEMGGYLGAANIGESVEPVDLVTGMDFVCALTTTGRVKCWGRNCNGQGGFGNVMTYGDDPDEMGDDLPFVDLGTGRTAESLAAGVAHVCALLDDGSVKCWGKGYYGQTGLEKWTSMGQIPGQMGDSLPAVDLGTSTTSASARKLGDTRGGGRGLRGLQTTTAVSVEGLSAGGQRSCAIVDGGSVKCWGRAFEGALGLEDTMDRGGRPGSMGDSLPTLSLGTDKVAVSPSPIDVPATPAPVMASTLAPSAANTPSPTFPPTVADTPTPGSPTPTPVLSTPPPTPSPTLAAETETARGVFEELTNDVGVTFTQGIAIAAGVPLIFLLVCCYCGFLVARKKKDKKDQVDIDQVAASDSSRKLGGANGHAASVAPVSRSNSRNGSRADLLSSTAYGPDGTGSLVGSEVGGGIGIFYAQGTDKNGETKEGDSSNAADYRGGEVASGWFAASRAPASGGGDGSLTSANVSKVPGGASKDGVEENEAGNGSKELTVVAVDRRDSSSETPPDTWRNQKQPIDAAGSFTPESNAGGSVLSRGESQRSNRADTTI